jgi:integrase
MPALKMTKAAIAGLPIGSRRTRYSDTQVQYLKLYVLPSGHKAWYYYRKHRGKLHEVLIGSFPACSIRNARDEAQIMSGRIVRGLPPRDEPAPSHLKVTTFGDLFASYLEHHAKPHKRTWKEDEGQYRRHLGEWITLPLEDFDTLTVSDLIAKLGARAPVAANRVLALVRKVFNYAIQDLDMELRNPTRRTKPSREEPRHRYMNAAEVGRFLATLDALAARPQPPIEWQDWNYWRVFFLVALYIGARVGSIRQMEWSELDFESGVWLVPIGKMKGKRDAVIVLPRMIVDLLRDWRKQSRKSRFVFPGREVTKPIIEIRHAWVKLCREAELVNLHPHDLRRTFGTWQLQSGASMATVRDSLSQRDIRVTQNAYAHVDVGHVRASVEETVRRFAETRPSQ